MKKAIIQINKDIDKLLLEMKNNKYDSTSNLLWHRCRGVTNWYDAIYKCEQLGGRLPTKKEIKTYHESKAITFKNVHYWTSTSYNLSGMWVYYALNGVFQPYDKNHSFNFYCVKENTLH